jgi:tetratricopeptide (TPR) repeat protein
MKQKLKFSVSASIVFLFACTIILGKSNLLYFESTYAQREFHMVEKKLVEKYKVAQKYYLEGKKKFIKEDFKKAEEELDKCLQVMPEHADAYYLLAQIGYKKGRFEEALDDIQKAVANHEYIAQFYTFTHQERLEILREQKRKAEEQILDFQDELNKLSGVSGTDAEMQRARIRSQIQARQNGISQIDSQMHEPVPDALQIPADYYYVYGNIFFKMKQFQKAYEQWTKTIEIDPKHGNAYNNLANLYFMSKQYDQALKYLELAESSGAEVNPEFKKALLKALEKK